MKSVVMILCAVLAGCAREPRKFDRIEVMIPMRDGARMHTLIYAPKGAGKLPFVIERSPYGWTGKKPDNALVNRYKELADEGFIFVFQDIRGRYQSDGTFVMQRPVHDRSVANSIDEGTDPYDPIDCLLKTAPANTAPPA